MHSTNRLRRPAVRLLAMAALLSMMFMLLTPMSFADPPQWDSWDYRLLGPLNSITDPDTGRTIVLRGSGSFVCDGDPCEEGSIDGGGSYTIVDSDGNAVGSGAWTAEELDTFAPHAPGNSPGQGGHLALWAEFTEGTGIGFLEGSFHMEIYCSMWVGAANQGTPGYPWDSDGVRINGSAYTESNPGAVMFNLNN